MTGTAPPVPWVRIAPSNLRAGVARAHVGVVIFDSDVTTELQIARLLPPELDVAVHIGRIVSDDAVTPEALLALEPELTDIAGRLAVGTRLDVIAYGCTSGSIALGPARVAAAIHRARPGVAVVTPVTAALDAFERLRVRRIALLAPYAAPLMADVMAFLAGAGLDLVEAASFDRLSDQEMARIDQASIRAAALQLLAGPADALFIACSSLRSSELVAELEAVSGKPVVTSVQAMIWASLAAAGVAMPPGHGRLLSSG